MPTEKEETALDMLREDHEKVRSMLQELVESDDRDQKGRSRLVEQIGKELRVHATLEETFYPALRAAADQKGPR